MRTTFALVLAVLLSSTQSFAADADWEQLPDDLVFRIIEQEPCRLEFSVTSIGRLGRVSKSFAARLRNNELWRRLCIFVYRYPNDSNSDKISYEGLFKVSYKQQRPLVILLTIQRLKFYYPQINFSRYRINHTFGFIQETVDHFQEILTASEKADWFARCFAKNPKVICATISLYAGENVIDNHVADIFERAKKDDVLLVLPVNNNPIFLPSNALGYDIHERYPNILWVTAAADSAHLVFFAGFGGLVDLAALGSEGSCFSVINMEHVLGNFRSVRRDLSAAQIRTILLKTADQTKETKAKHLTGGFFNPDKALDAIVNF